MLKHVISTLGTFSEGDEVDLHESVATEWIRVRHAEPVGSKAPGPEMAVATAGENAATRSGGRSGLLGRRRT